MINKEWMRNISAAVAWLCVVFGSAPSSGQDIPLSSLHPVRTLSYYPNRDVTPQTSAQVAPGRQALRLKVESEVTYAVPPNQSSFGGVVSYQPPRYPVADGMPPYYVPALVRIMANDKTVLEQGLNETTPPLQFSVPVASATQITISIVTPLLGNEVSLEDAHFSATKSSSPQTRFQPAPQAGYVDWDPAPRQKIYGIFQAGEEVPVNVYFCGKATEASVLLRFTPEQLGRPAWSLELKAPLSVAGALSQGTATWKVPNVFGPGTLEVSETIAGQTVFSQTRRVAIGVITDLSRVFDSTFGFHASTDGYIQMPDEFAGLWGAKWARFFMHWSAVEPSVGQFDFSRVDALLNLYRAQHMRVLVVAGEDSPAWAGAPGSSEYASFWQQYVMQIARHFAGQVDAWDVFNEVDVKYNVSIAKGAPADWDVAILKSAIQALRSADPRATIVCCSTGSALWLPYDKKLLDEFVLTQADAISLHPYQHPAPEQKDGAFNYLENLNAIRTLIASYGIHKPIWSTEANWIIKPGTTTITEDDQAEYVVRVNLLSAAAGVRYFLHAPYSHVLRPQPHLSTWASYAEMSSLFSNASNVKLVADGPQVFAVTATTTYGHVGAVWTVAKDAQVRIDAKSEKFFDMYGNALPASTASTTASPAPIYFVGTGPAPGVEVLSEPWQPEWRSVEPFANWLCVAGATCNRLAGGVRITSLPSKYRYQLMSSVINLQSGTCERVRMQVALEKGAIDFFAVDASSGKMLEPIAITSFVADGQPHLMELRFYPTGSVKLVIANANNTDVQSSFTVFGQPQIAECQ